MSTRINITSQLGSLLDRLKAQQRSARTNKATTDARNKALAEAAEKKRQQDLERQRRLSGSDRRPSLRDEPAASSYRPIQLCQTWIGLSDYDGNIKLYSADGTHSVVCDHYTNDPLFSSVVPPPGFYPWNSEDELYADPNIDLYISQWTAADLEDPDGASTGTYLACIFPVPLDKNNMIVVVCRGSLYLYYKPWQYLQAECFLVGNRVARKISVPSTLSTWLANVVNPGVELRTTSSSDGNTFIGNPTSWGWWDKLPSRDLSLGLGSTGFEEYQQRTYYEVSALNPKTTAIYIANTGTPSAIDVILGPGTRKYRQWVQLRPSAITPNTLQPFVYGNYDPVTGVPTDPLGGTSRSRPLLPKNSPFNIPLPPQRFADLGNGFPEPIPPPPWEGSRHYASLVTWDWGASGYAKQRLLQLGFTEADLTVPEP